MASESSSCLFIPVQRKILFLPVNIGDISLELPQVGYNAFMWPSCGDFAFLASFRVLR